MTHFWEKPLSELTPDEWEALCDGCAKCCVLKLEDEDTEKVHYTSIGCRLLNSKTCRCKNYKNRKKLVPGCVIISPDNIGTIAEWMPKSCAYKLRYEESPLPKWHYLLTGNKNDVHRAGHSVQNKTISEDNVSEDEFENYITHEV